MADAKREGELGKKLARWADIRRQHEEAQARLRESTRLGTDGACLRRLESEVLRLRQLEDAGLEALQNLFDAMRPRQPAKPAVPLQTHLDLD
jgi:hypothetical protein